MLVLTSKQELTRIMKSAPFARALKSEQSITIIVPWLVRVFWNANEDVSEEEKRWAMPSLTHSSLSNHLLLNYSVMRRQMGQLSRGEEGIEKMLLEIDQSHRERCFRAEKKRNIKINKHVRCPVFRRFLFLLAVEWALSSYISSIWTKWMCEFAASFSKNCSFAIMDVFH